MTTWRLSVQRSHLDIDDVVVEATDEATIADLRDELERLGFTHRSFLVDGQEVDDDETLDTSPLRHGSLLSSHGGSGYRVDPGWYLVAVAGPDTGAWVAVTSERVSVGRSSSNDLTIRDSTLSGVHFFVRLANEEIIVEDLGSRNGTLLEGEQVDGSSTATGGTYIGAGVTTFGVIHITAKDLAPITSKVAATLPFQRRFRDALQPLPDRLVFPTSPSERPDSRRPWASLIVPVITTIGMGLGMMLLLNTGGDQDANLTILGLAIPKRLLYIAIIAIGPIFMAFDGLRRRKKQVREDARKSAEYEEKHERFLSQLREARVEERDRDRWAATPAGMAALLTRIPHSRLWERSGH